MLVDGLCCGTLPVPIDLARYLKRYERGTLAQGPTVSSLLFCSHTSVRVCMRGECLRVCLCEVCVLNGLQSLQLSMSETLNFILMQGAVQHLAWNFSQELRFPVFRRLQQFLTEDVAAICCLLWFEGANLGSKVQDYSGVLVLSKNNQFLEGE